MKNTFRVCSIVNHVVNNFFNVSQKWISKLKSHYCTFDVYFVQFGTTTLNVKSKVE